jgi:hypothetical protein
VPSSFSAVASSVGVTSQPEVTLLPLPLAPAPAPPPATDAAVSNAAAASCCSSDSGSRAESGAGCTDRHILIVASDGLWEWISNATAVGIAACAASGKRDQCHAAVSVLPPRWEAHPAHTVKGSSANAMCMPASFAAAACRALPAADDAAHALLEAAQKQWAVRYRGRNCDDITVVVAFLHR